MAFEQPALNRITLCRDLSMHIYIGLFLRHCVHTTIHGIPLITPWFTLVNRLHCPGKLGLTVISSSIGQTHAHMLQFTDVNSGVQYTSPIGQCAMAHNTCCTIFSYVVYHGIPSVSPWQTTIIVLSCYNRPYAFTITSVHTHYHCKR